MTNQFNKRYEGLLEKFQNQDKDKELQRMIFYQLFIYKNYFNAKLQKSSFTNNWKEILFSRFKELDISHDLIKFYKESREDHQYKYDIPSEYDQLYQNLFQIITVLKEKLTFEEMQTKYNEKVPKIITEFFTNVKSFSSLDLLNWIYSLEVESELKFYVSTIYPKPAIFIESRKYLIHIKEIEDAINKMAPSELLEKDVLLVYKEKMNDPKVNLICKRLDVERKKIQSQYSKEDIYIVDFLKENIKISTEIMIHVEKL